MLDLGMKDKCILITGASSGIGETVARFLNSQGATVVLVARDEEKMKKIVGDLEGENYIFPYDLSNLANIDSIFKFCVSKGLRLHGMVHCAGVCNNIPIKANDIEDMQNTMTVNYFAFVELGRLFSLKKYSNEGSSIVAMSSTASIMCDMGMAQYSASKAAINASVKTMSKEFIRRRLRVNAIAPAFVDTEMAWRTANDVENFEENLLKIQPLGIISTQHVANMIAFLLSDASSYITGTIIPMTAGMHLNE